MGLHCSYGACKSRIKNLKCKVKGGEGVFFIKFPSPKNDVEKCRKWISACGRDNLTLENINKSSYICSRHFHGFQGPTPEHPDPIPINSITPQRENHNNTRNFKVGTETPKVLKSVCPRQLPYSVSPFKIDFKNLHIPKGWALGIDEDIFTFIKLQKNWKVIEVTISSKANSASVKVLDKNIDPQGICPNFAVNSANDINIFLSKLDEFSVCPGNDESDLVTLYKQSRKAPTGKGVLCTQLDSVYSRSCLGLFKKSSNTPRCQKCSLYRCTLRVMKARSFKKTEA